MKHAVYVLQLQGDQEVVVYDQSSSGPSSLSSESFLSVLLLKLERSFPSVHLLSGQCQTGPDPYESLVQSESSPVRD